MQFDGITFMVKSLLYVTHVRVLRQQWLEIVKMTPIAVTTQIGIIGVQLQMIRCAHCSGFDVYHGLG